MTKEKIINQIQQAALHAAYEISSMIENSSKNIVDDENTEDKQ